MLRKKKRKKGLERLLSRLNKRISKLEQQLNQLSQFRFITFILGFVLSAFIFLNWGANWWGVTLIPLSLPFLILVFLYGRVNGRKERWQRWRHIKRGHLDRMTLNWEQLPPSKVGIESKEHPFGLDLDLVGERSLHQLINTAVSMEASQRLMTWLLETRPDLDTILRRQSMVKELQNASIFRDKLTMQATAVLETGGSFIGQTLVDWLNKKNASETLRKLLVRMVALISLTWSLFFFSDFLPLPNLWLGVWLIYLVLYTRISNQYTGELFQDATFLADRLDVLNIVFGFLENGRFSNQPAIKALCAPFLNPLDRPSRHIRRLQRVMIGVGLRQNPLLGLILNLVFPWDLLFATLLTQQQEKLKSRLPVWLDVWNEVEALSSLANFAYLNPGLTHYPVITDHTETVFEAINVAHPLIQDSQRVGNDFGFDQLGQIGLITGSNMAGKSSFLRTAGLNLALAYAGGAVMADSFKSQLFRLYSSIRIEDSLQDGFSFFYAEVRRLRAILTAYEQDEKRPLFFLIDEIFKGTNNRERLIGSQSLIQKMTAGNGVGLIATHDLELVKLADEDSNIINYHFRDDVKEGQMIFDYRLRTGPSPTTNALKIMALAGLPVPKLKQIDLSERKLEQ